MHDGSGAKGRISAVKREIVFLLVLAMITAGFGTFLAPQAEALYQYIGKNSKTAWSGGYQGYAVDDYPYTTYYPYSIIGWNCNKDSVDKLMKKATFTNSEGTSL